MIDEARKIKAGALALCHFSCPQNFEGAQCAKQCAATDNERLYGSIIFRRFERMAEAVLKAADA